MTDAARATPDGDAMTRGTTRDAGELTRGATPAAGDVTARRREDDMTNVDISTSDRIEREFDRSESNGDSIVRIERRFDCQNRTDVRAESEASDERTDGPRTTDHELAPLSAPAPSGTSNDGIDHESTLTAMGKFGRPLARPGHGPMRSRAVYVDDPTWDRATERGEADGVSASEVVRRALDAYLG